MWSLAAPPSPRLLMLSLIVLLSQTTPTHPQTAVSNGHRAAHLLLKIASSPWPGEKGRDDNDDDFALQAVSFLDLARPS